MIKSAAIIPTGDEILNGTVLDTDSSEIMRILISEEPACQISRFCPVQDEESAIEKYISNIAGKFELIVLIGGSGGGHQFSDTLGKDFTHIALEALLEDKQSREIYGYNGHLWSKLVCGRYNNSLILNVPGPFVEARAAITAFCTTYKEKGEDLEAINGAMADAVIAQYPKKKQ